jgi:hypothetical protein
MKTLSRPACLLIVPVLLSVLQFGLVCQVKAQIRIGDQLPENERKLANDLEQDKSIVEVSCKRNTANLWNCMEANQIKLSLYKAVRSGKQIIKAKTYSRTTEGDKIIKYLILEQGKTRLILDYSRDEISPPRVRTVICSNLALAHYEQVDGKVSPVLKFITDKQIEEAKSKEHLVLICLQENQNKSAGNYIF